MCGFITFVNASLKNEVEIGSGLRRLSHRGPDDYGWLAWDGANCQFGRDNPTAKGRVVMGHRRLSILDLSSNGREPMPSSDGRLYITYNGEVYNYREMRAELEGLGHSFHTRTDTEVLLAAIGHWGIEVVRRFKGMFAFTVLDVERRKLYAVRDHFGIKPLYYCSYKDGIALASEIPPLLDLPGISKKADAQALYDYLQFGITSHNAGTMFDGIKQLPPASLLEIDLETMKVGDVLQYWRLAPEENDCGGYRQATARVRDLFLENIRLHLRSDVPIGSALSGGIDSSAIVCGIRAVDSTADIRTFSYIAPGTLSEERWVDIVNSHVGAKAVKVAPGAQELWRDVEDLVAAQGEPFGSTSIYAQYSVFRAAAQQNIKVMLDGQGADELLAGYVGYQGSYFASLVKQGRISEAVHFLRGSTRWPGRSKIALLQLAGRHLLPKGVQGVARSLIGKELMPSWMNVRWFRQHGVAFDSLTRKYGCKTLLRADLIETLQRTSLPALLRYEDRNSMHFSIESRVPFLTYDFAELILGLPEDYLIDATGCSKRIFRDAMRGIVPQSILDRRDKIGFATPEQKWLLESRLFNDIQKKLNNYSNVFELEKMSAYMNKLKANATNRDFRLWRVVNFVMWAQSFDVGFYNKGIM